MENQSDKMQTDWPSILDELREKEALPSDAQLAASLGVTRGYICSVRKGRKSVSLELAKKIFSKLERTFETENLEKLFVPEKVRHYTRSLHALRRHVISRAGGHCQLCGGSAPFNLPEGLPYLELHHVIPLRDGGDDSPNNLVALCPNCNKKIELAPDPADVRKLRELGKILNK